MSAKMFGLSVLLAVACGCGEKGSPERTAVSTRVTSAYDSVTLVLPVGNARDGRQALLDLKCTTCHQVAGETGFPAPFSDSLGPDLDSRHPPRSPSDLATAIVAPSHSVSTNTSRELKTRLEGTLSPMGDFNQSMTVRQLSDIVAYLRQAPAKP